MATKMAGKQIWQNLSNDSLHSLFFEKFHQNLTLFPRKMPFMCFMQNFKIAAKIGWKTIFGTMCQMTQSTLGVKNLPNSSCAVSETSAFLHFIKKFKNLAKNGTKTIFAKNTR